MTLYWWLHILNEAVSIGLNNLGASLRGEASELTTLGIPQGVWQPSMKQVRFKGNPVPPKHTEPKLRFLFCL
jgi:hypothetical protein